MYMSVSVWDWAEYQLFTRMYRWIDLYVCKKNQLSFTLCICITYSQTSVTIKDYVMTISRRVYECVFYIWIYCLIIHKPVNWKFKTRIILLYVWYNISNKEVLSHINLTIITVIWSRMFVNEGCMKIVYELNIIKRGRRVVKCGI